MTTQHGTDIIMRRIIRTQNLKALNQIRNDLADAYGDLPEIKTALMKREKDLMK